MQSNKRMEPTRLLSRAITPVASEEILLEPRSLLALAGEGPWQWRHGIPRRTSDVWQGRELVRSRRVSLAFRAVPE
jgi:hypothetical protein